ncbi:hypothetical protein B0T26DRAFT_714900 [Lasiosphaeria miniovina]|uniref:Uncharacterized protein n=1 Tax=Lasiosphaeria miniovina TaxID=1954250 RepID=A0AA40AB98_9PEZI|nr:uncharacterized protein B0T26DRAFT_714900 [Lasiosphaeria miniovina]KAK0712661.1 hypothetical protein B0T26DRAFT_714900 [Lasiosphaeria miniovina]
MKNRPVLQHFVAGLAAVTFLILWGAASAVNVAVNPAPDFDFGPSEEAARQNGFHIFNAVHSALRQWGSSLNHNGLSLFLATVPNGVLLYHGDDVPDQPPSFEWLAFEIEHAEQFARPRRSRRMPDPPLGLLNQHAQDGQAKSAYDDGDEEPHEYPGYLQIYRVTKPFRVLYVDGMGAGKTDLGTLDTQDFLLRNSRSEHPIRDYERGQDLCDIAVAWGLQGVLRMEAGFEIIKCNFSDSIELVSVRQRPALADPGSEDYFEISHLEYMRAVSQRYHGIGSGRAVLDFSSMVSALFYPVNLTNPDPERPELLRLAGATEKQLHAIRLRLAEVVKARGGDTPASSIDWQGVVDMIVARYADRLKSMADKTKSLGAMRGAINQLLNLHIDYPPEGKKEIGKVELERCTKHDTALLVPRTQEDHLILAVIEHVTSSICSALFSVRKLVVADPNADEVSLSAAVKIFQDLVDRLQWTRWKQCPLCEYDEVCFVAMWPFGDTESHEQPSCRNSSTIGDHSLGSYWPHWSQRPGSGNNNRSYGTTDGDGSGRRDL